MKRLALLVVLVVGCDDGNKKVLPADDPDGYCTVVAEMDRLCPAWREQSEDYREGCFAAAYVVADEEYSDIPQDIAALLPDPDECLE